MSKLAKERRRDRQREARRDRAEANRSEESLDRKNAFNRKDLTPWNAVETIRRGRLIAVAG